MTRASPSIFFHPGGDKSPGGKHPRASTADLTLLIATGLFAIASWLTCVWILCRLVRATMATRNASVPPGERAAFSPLHPGGPGSRMLPAQTARRRHSG